MNLYQTSNVYRNVEDALGHLHELEYDQVLSKLADAKSAHNTEELDSFLREPCLDFLNGCISAVSMLKQGKLPQETQLKKIVLVTGLLWTIKGQVEISKKS